MKLDARLGAVAALVPRGARVADIGSDHGYLAMHLWCEGGAAAVIAADKNEGPCGVARRTLAVASLAEDIAVRCGDGLSVLQPQEVDTVCLAGMGGELMIAILAAAPSITAGLRRLVLQPMNDAPLLRRWLYDHGWHIAAESLAEVEGRLYEIIAAEPGAAPLPEDSLLRIGPCLWEDKPPLLRSHIEALLGKARRVAAGMARSPAARESEGYQRLLKEIEELEAKLIW